MTSLQIGKLDLKDGDKIVIKDMHRNRKYPLDVIVVLGNI